MPCPFSVVPRWASISGLLELTLQACILPNLYSDCQGLSPLTSAHGQLRREAPFINYRDLMKISFAEEEVGWEYWILDIFVHTHPMLMLTINVISFLHTLSSVR
jgi:hypothetical protein